MRNYTIIGVFDDTGEVMYKQVKAQSAIAAMIAIAVLYDGNSDLQILGAITGAHSLITPGSDNIRASYASDLATLEG